MWLVLRMEVLGIYIVLMYASDMEVYGLLVIVGLGIVIVIGGLNGYGSVIILCLIWPFITVYVGWIGMMIGRLKINESLKKILVFRVAISMLIFNLSWLYIFALGYFVGMVAVSPLRVYAFVMLTLGFAFVLVLYLIFGWFINLNYKILIIGLLPLPVFFVKMCGMYLIMYTIFLIRCVNIIL